MASKLPPDWAATGFASGTFVQTARGLRPVERLVPGEDMLEGRDGSEIALLDVMTTRFTASALKRKKARQPVLIPALSLGAAVPARPLLVSQDMRIHAKGRLVNRVTETPEVLLPVSALIGTYGIELTVPDGGVTYHHLICEGHHLLKVEGLMCETLYAGEDADEALRTRAGRTHLEPALPRISLEMADRLTSKLARKNRPPLPEEEEAE
ncbi:MAG: Hint domain-containing protein [Pseudomonadota bacterium]